MTVDLKWHDAMASAAWAFDSVERAAGWPGSMTPAQLASLQRQWVRDDPVSKRHVSALVAAIQQSCVVGELLHEQREVTRYKTEYQQGHRIRHGSIGERWEPVTTRVQVPYQVPTQYVTAVAFAEWLRTQGEEPSQYIAHWFKVQGVAAPEVLQLVPPAQAVDAVGKPEESEWTPERLWDTLTDFEGRGEKAPMQKLSKLSGVPERTIRAKVKPLRDMKKSPFGGLVNRSNRSG